MIQQPPLLNPVINTKSNNRHDYHLWKHCSIEAAVHNPLTEQFVLKLKLKIAFFVDLVGLELSEETVTTLITV